MKKIRIYIFIPFLLIVFGCITFISCTKMDETYKDFIKDGEIIFTGKVDSLTALPGKNKVKLHWLLVSDPKITKNVVYWNNFKDSISFDVQKTAGTDTITSIIDNLTEGVYTFSVFTRDNFGNSSVKADVIGVVYGDNYANTLSNRPLSTAYYDPIITSPTYKSAIITWFGVSAQAVVMEINYTDNKNIDQTVVVVPEIDPNYPNRPKALPEVTLLPNYKEGTSFSYRTGYKPVANSIDTFYTDFALDQQVELLPSPPVILSLNMPVKQSSSNASKVTDGDYTTYWQPNSSDRPDLNVWFTVDLGESQSFSKAILYISKDPKKVTGFEILYSDDDLSWKSAYNFNAVPSGEETVTFPEVTARYVKCSINIEASNANINVSEFEVWDK